MLCSRLIITLVETAFAFGVNSNSKNANEMTKLVVIAESQNHKAQRLCIPLSRNVFRMLCAWIDKGVVPN
jgi:hypothetical protein